MLPTPVSAVLGFCFILFGAAAVWLIFESSRRTHSPTKRDRIIQAHRLAGYLFIALFCIMTWFMIVRNKNGPDELPLRPMLHILIAMVLAPLLLVKVLIARYYKSFTTALVPLGVTIFTLGFVLIALTAGPFLVRRAAVRDVSLQTIQMGAARIDLESAQALTQKRCSRCHALDRVLGARKDARGWLGTIDRMRALPGSGISEPDAKIILSYLISEASIDSSNMEGELAVGKAPVDSHCNRCHTLDRAYESKKSPAEWRATVMRMVRYARGTDGFFRPGEDERIIQVLSATQHREATQGRVSDGPDLSRGRRPPAKTPALTERAEAILNFPAIAVATFTAAVFGALLLRRPKSTLKEVSGAGRVSPTPVQPSRKPFILQLVRIERQTHDCVSLRFRVAGTDLLGPKPGQFLTFDWLLDGQKLARSYSIASSPTQTGFVEIAVKQQPGGCVSHFLNAQASVGLTVEARGPFGQFCFDPNKHKSIILFAGGSGITPILSILRYIDDRCLDTKAVLFFSVRTDQDIIFEEELEQLGARLPLVKLVIVPTRRDNGEVRHLSREQIVWELDELRSHTFFLCGPEAFMDHVRGILLSLDVDPSRILQERFGGKKLAAQTDLEAEILDATIEFNRSGQSCVFSTNRTLLEAAEMNGVSIPSSCRQGQCGTCATRLLDGQAEMDCEDGLDPALKAQGYVLACVALAKGNVRIDA
jgi:ferredoxin-NADP reductase/cytochrome c2